MADSININDLFVDAPVVSQISGLWTTWNSGRVQWMERMREVIQYVYATSTKETTNAENGWSHTTHIPKLTQIYDNLGANYYSALFGNRDWFTFKPGNQDDAVKSKVDAIEKYLSTKHDWSGFLTMMGTLLDDWSRYGNCFARIEYVRELGTDPITGEEYIVYEGPKVRRISPYDIVFDHRASAFEKSPVIIRSLLSKGDLMRDTLEKPELDYDPAVVQELLNYRATIATMDQTEVNKQIQRNFDGFNDASSYFASGEIEILEFVGSIYVEETGEYHSNQLITVADRKFILRNRPVATYEGREHIYHVGWRDRPDNLWSMGPLENLVGMQYLIDHLENARADAFDQMLAPDRVHIGNVQVEEDGPITNYWVDDANGDVKNLAPDATVLQADFQIQVKEAQMEAYAGAPKEAMGQRSPGEKTAFEVQQLATAASRLFQHKIEKFERDFLEKILNGELSIAVQNLNVVDTIAVIDDDLGVEEFVEINREDLVSRGQLKARGASHFAKRATLVQELLQFNNVLLSDPAMAVHFPPKKRAKLWVDVLNMDESKIYEEFGALAEQAEAAKMQDLAGKQVIESEVADDIGTEE